jgi:hypothetical protein
VNQDLHHALSASGSERQQLEAHYFRISQHDIHILDGFAGSALDQMKMVGSRAQAKQDVFDSRRRKPRRSRKALRS